MLSLSEKERRGHPSPRSCSGYDAATTRARTTSPRLAWAARSVDGDSQALIAPDALPPNRLPPRPFRRGSPFREEGSHARLPLPLTASGTEIQARDGNPARKWTL